MAFFSNFYPIFLSFHEGLLIEVVGATVPGVKILSLVKRPRSQMLVLPLPPEVGPCTRRALGASVSIVKLCYSVVLIQSKKSEATI